MGFIEVNKTNIRTNNTISRRHQLFWQISSAKEEEIIMKIELKTAIITIDPSEARRMTIKNHYYNIKDIPYIIC